MLNRRMINNCLKLDGHLCEEAEDGLEAVSRVIDLQQQCQQQQLQREQELQLQQQLQSQQQQQQVIPSVVLSTDYIDIEAATTTIVGGVGVGGTGPLVPISPHPHKHTLLLPINRTTSPGLGLGPSSGANTTFSCIFDVVLMDNHMPRMNGTTATQGRLLDS